MLRKKQGTERKKLKLNQIFKGMKRKDLITAIFFQINQIDNSITDLRKEKQSLFEKLSLIKKEIEFENKHLIGKRAIANIENGTKNISVICTGVKCLDDFSIKPLFNITKSKKKVTVDYYEWEN